MTKTVLIIAYHYPPENIGGSQRAAAFAAYLLEYGFRPVVVTKKYRDCTDHDKDVYRFADPVDEMIRAGGIKGFLLRALRKVLYRSGLIKGYYRFWSKNVLKALEDLVKKHKPSFVLATYPPLETMMIGYELRAKYGLPLVLDFRDGLVFEPLDKMFSWEKSRARRVEEKLVDSASVIVTVSEPITEYFKRQYPQQKAITISNGFDPGNYEGLEKVKLAGAINIVYTGRLSGSNKGIDIRYLLKGLALLDSKIKKRLKIYFVGELARWEIKAIEDCNDHALFILTGPLERDVALSYQLAADYLLLITDSKKQSVATTKLFEYLAAEKPIIALTLGSVAEKIVAETRTGICASPADPKEIAAVLGKVITDHPHQGFYLPDWELINCYNRRHLTGELAKALTNLGASYR